MLMLTTFIFLLFFLPVDVIKCQKKYKNNSTFVIIECSFLCSTAKIQQHSFIRFPRTATSRSQHLILLIIFLMIYYDYSLKIKCSKELIEHEHTVTLSSTLNLVIILFNQSSYLVASSLTS